MLRRKKKTEGKTLLKDVTIFTVSGFYNDEAALSQKKFGQKDPLVQLQ